MPTIHDDFVSLYAYNHWADDRIVGAVRELTPDQYTALPAPGWTSVRSTLVHMGDGLTIWARRLAGENPRAARLEDDVPTFEDAERLLREGRDVFEQQLFGLSNARLESTWTYTNFKGVTCTLPLWTVFRHLANHATYHRGQIASKLRLFGIDAPSTDLVYWAIEQTPQPG